MRYTFSKGKQTEMILFTKVTLGLSWRDLAHNIGIGYTTLLDARDEKWTMKQSVFDFIVKICPESAFFIEFIVEKKEDNWGQPLVVLAQNIANTGFLTQNMKIKMSLGNQREDKLAIVDGILE